MDVCNIIDIELAKLLMPKRPQDSNKGTFGKVLNFAGCKEYVGAAYLSSVAPLRVGAGLVELAAPNCVKESVSKLTPDIIFADMGTQNYLETLPSNKELGEYSAVIVGCGLGNNKLTQKFLKKFLEVSQEYPVPIIYDADALNIIAQEGIIQLGSKSVLTPHPGEMARLMGCEIGDVQSDRENWAKKAAQKYKSVVVLKGHNTIVACPDGKTFMDILGTNVLAKAGMGDVLAGIIAGLCAQGLNVRQASVLGVYIHSKSAQCAEAVRTTYGLLASELLAFIPDGIKSIIS